VYKKTPQPTDFRGYFYNGIMFTHIIFSKS
jgi:hypothetical protein